jgi:hypothetical protein
MASILSAGTSSGTALNLSGDTSGILQLASNNGTTAVTIDTSQNVSIGTTTTSYGKFSVNGTINPLAGNKIQFQNSSNSNYSAIYNPSTDSGASLAFQNGGGTVISILSNGATIMGTATTENGQNSISFSNSSDTSSYGKAMLFNTQYSSTRNAVVFQYNSGTVGTIITSTTNTSYNTSSDYRLKDNPQPLTGSGAFIDALQPKTWTWKIDGSSGVGFLAHEAQEVFPQSVHGEKDAIDADGKPIIQSMEYGSAEFIANMVAELQDLRKRVAALEAK